MEQNKKNNFALYVLLIMIVTALLLKVINYYTKTGKVEINKREFSVEIAQNDWERIQGLSGRKELRDSQGKLFVFSKPDYYSFWMKGMKFPIDIIWINEGKIVDIKDKAPVPATQFLESYKPAYPAKYVLEINAGLAQKYGFKAGDEVKIDL